MWYRRITFRDEHGNRCQRELKMGSKKDSQDFKKLPQSYWDIVHSGGYLMARPIEKEK